MELNPKYLEALFEHRVQEAVQQERDRIITILSDLDSREDLCGIDYAIALIKKDSDV